MPLVTCYIQYVPEWYDGVDDQGRRTLFRAHAARMTVREPAEPLPGAVVVPMTLDIPEALFGATDAVSGRVEGGPAGPRLVADQ